MKITDSKDAPPVLFVSVIIFITFVIVFASWFICAALLSQAAQKVQTNTDVGMENFTRLNYIKQEESYLKSSKQLDNDHYKIPIEQAMNEVIQKENQ